MATYVAEALNDPSKFFKVQLYTGTGSSNAITFNDTDTDMAPDLVWVKKRDATGDHYANDSVRGVTKKLEINSTSQEETDANSLTAFGSDGFTVGSTGAFNSSSNTFVAWCWKESATSGFDIVTYSGSGSARTISHSLSAVPKMIIIKNRDTVKSWQVGHESIGWGNGIYLNETSASQSDNGAFNSTDPTTSVFSLGTSSYVNTSSDDYVAYLWSEKQGFSKFGSYVGNNGGSNGVFVYTGFRPKLVIQKLSSGSGANWIMRDTARDTYNPMDNQIEANTLDAKEDNHAIDFLSNGFKTRANGLNQQDNGETYIYMAFAEAPFVNSNGVPCNAR